MHSFIITYRTRVLLILHVLLDVPLAIVLANELRAAVVARVWPDALVRVKVRDVVGLADERRPALVALERLGGARCMRPPVQLEVPLGREVLVAD